MAKKCGILEKSNAVQRQCVCKKIEVGLLGMNLTEPWSSEKNCAERQAIAIYFYEKGMGVKHDKREAAMCADKTTTVNWASKEAAFDWQTPLQPRCFACLNRYLGELWQFLADHAISQLWVL